MSRRSTVVSRILLAALWLIIYCGVACAQNTIQPNSIPGQLPSTAAAPAKDTNLNKSNNKKWKDDVARITFVKVQSNIIYKPDTSLRDFDRRPFLQSWYEDLGNLGSPALDLYFTPEYHVGPTLGYHVFDIYRFNVDSLNYYNTTRPYSVFTYELGSKLEQVAQIMHTQNIKPNWNFAVNYRKIYSPGFFKIERNIGDNANLSTNYKSINQHYTLFAGVVYNKLQHDENGGITDYSQLNNPAYSDKQTMDVAFENDEYSVTRSSVSNILRDFDMSVHQSYTWGRVDTSYNSDSTHYTATMIPRFGITHTLAFSTELYQYKDVMPDSLRYSDFFNQYFVDGDSVFMEQKWWSVDNSLLLNGYLGAQGQLLFTAGAGYRLDEFATEYGTGSDKTSIGSAYITGSLKKEAAREGQWMYDAQAKLFVTGDDAGDFDVNGYVGKSFQNRWADIKAGFGQQLGSAPYNYDIYQNEYFRLINSFNRESISHVYLTLQSERLHFAAGLDNYLIDNYFFINEQQLPAQYDIPFNITQVWVHKEFIYHRFHLDNEFAYQQLQGNAPVNVPAFMGRNRLSYQAYLFHNNLKIATGIEVRYTTPYDPAGYDPFLMRFYYQTVNSVSNYPATSVFFNFRIKQFRAYLMADQLQEIFLPNNINFPGYPSQSLNIRFGFAWVLID